MLSSTINLYTRITKDCTIAQLGPPFTFYLADQMKTNLLATDLIELDVKSAFPTICTFLFGKEHPFVKEIFRINDKLKRNIYISTTLTEQSKIDGKPYLNDLNLWSKILVLGYVYSKYEDINILEYVKDGILFTGTLRSSPMQEFLDFTQENNVQFHDKIVNIYIRFTKTSVYKVLDKVKVKGIFHNPPEYIINILQLLLSGHQYDYKLLYDIKKFYSDIYFNILFKSLLNDDIKHYYEFDNSRYININGNLSGINEIFPKGYLEFLIYPILSLLRLKKEK